MSDLQSSREAEISILGTLMVEPTAFARVYSVLKSGDFFFPETKKVYETMNELFLKNIEINVQTVLNYFKATGYTGITESELRSFLDYRVSVETALSFSVQVAEFSGWRSLKFGIEQLSKDVTSHSLTLQETAQKMTGLASLVTSKGLKDDIVHGASIIDEYMTMLNRPKDMYAFSGISEVDLSIFDFNPKELSYIAARPGTGKTGFMLQSALSNALKGNKVGFLSMEMERPKLINRLISSVSGVSGTKTVRMSPSEFSRDSKLVAAIEKISNLPLYIDDTGPWTSDSVPQKIRKLVYEYDCNIVYVDYIGLIVGSGALASAPRNQQLTKISADLKGLASELSVPILAASQLNRDVEKRGVPRPVLADLRDSGSLEQDASIVAFLYPNMPQDMTPDETKSIFENSSEVPVMLEIAKQRNGPVDQYELTFIKKIGKFVLTSQRNSTY